MRAVKTYLVRAQGITALFFNNRILSAWDTTGQLLNLWFAYVVLKDAAPAPLAGSQKGDASG